MALAVLAAALGVRTLDRSHDWVLHTREVREYLSATMSALLDAESAQRGYLLTHNAAYAEQSAAARRRLAPDLETLARLTRDNSVQQSSLREVRALLEERLALMDRTLALEQAGASSEALRVMQTGRGQALTTALRERLERMQSEEERLLQSRTALDDQARRSVLIAIFGTGLLAFFLLVLLRVRAGREERQRASREARLAEQARLLDLSRDAIIVRDAADRVRYWSQGAIDLYGYSRDEALGRVSHELLRTESDETLEQMRATLERTGGWHGELRHTSKSGQRIATSSTWTLNRDAAGVVQTILEANDDITARKAAEESLIKSRERLEFALRAAGIGLWEWDSQSNQSFWSEQEFELLGLTPTPGGLVETRTFFERVYADDRNELASHLTSVLASGGELSRAFRICHPQKGVRWLAGRGRVVGGADGAARRLIGLNWDITDAKETQAELQRSNQDLAQLTRQLEKRVGERTRELSEANMELEAFARSVAHDLRAPLRTMQGFATALIEDYGGRLPAEGQSFAKRIATAAERMDQLILDLLDYARLSRAEIRLEPIALEHAVRTVAAELTADPSGEDERVTIGVGSLAVQANRTLLTQVLVNLISNAFKFVAAGTEPRVEVFADRNRGRVRVWVGDNGIGIAPEHHERIFGVFERLHGYESYPGTGIGLAIVRRAVERMGGTVGVVSEIGRGSRFWFELAEARAEPASAVEQDPRTRATGSP